MTPWVRPVIAGNYFALGMSVAPQKRRLFARISPVVKGEEQTHAVQQIRWRFEGPILSLDDATLTVSGWRGRLTG